MSKNDETYLVDDETVNCSGNGGSLGHPAVYLNIMPAGEVTCPYCSRHFVLRTPRVSGH
ncbi:Zinc-finger domain-containing protein [Candidatus Bealeia paramacronuclearis]|uniref:Zinc-finger domain-containing protein n=1 Tax=Candidatus Bealeia paramacronuclearis TaxID=1921001 RepID=A0ABZ2C4N6_9PROT|nr:Zinc-finger domain-containing protein [Candidatus Bealeia paramacronuclearis]